MNQEEKLSKGIGNLEAKKLAEGNVKVIGVKIEEVKNRKDEAVGEKVVFIVKHPDREDNLQISKLRYLKNEKVESSGTWYNLDEENNIVKQSALASLMKHYACLSINDFIGKEVQTILDGSYLSIKAY
jgi:hypothetical protein